MIAVYIQYVKNGKLLIFFFFLFRKNITSYMTSAYYSRSSGMSAYSVLFRCFVVGTKLK